MKSSIDNSVNLGGNQTIKGIKTFDSETRFENLNSGNTQQGQVRLINLSGQYGVIMRADNSSLYFLFTDKGNPKGGWNNIRPLTINLNDGKVAINAPFSPAYGSGTGWSWGEVHTAPANGVLRVGAAARDNSAASLRYNSASGPLLWEHGDYGGASFGIGVVPVRKGDKYIASGGNSSQTLTFYPLMA